MVWADARNSDERLIYRRDGGISSSAESGWNPAPPPPRWVISGKLLPLSGPWTPYLESWGIVIIPVF